MASGGGGSLTSAVVDSRVLLSVPGTQDQALGKGPGHVGRILGPAP